MDDRSLRSHWLARHILPAEPALRAWLKGRLANSAIAVDDVVQESYAVLVGLADVSHIHSPQQYLFQVAHSIVVAQYRRAKIVPIDLVAELGRLNHADDAPSPEAEAIGRQQLLHIQSEIAALPERQRQAFHLVKIEGLSHREAAAVMGISLSTVEKHIARALITLMQHWSDGGSGGSQASSKGRAARRDEQGEPRRNRRAD